MNRSPEASAAPVVAWTPVVTFTDLLEARIAVGDGIGDGTGLYAGYVGHTPRDGDDQWRGYVGVTHVLVSISRREDVQAAVEQAAREAWAARQERAMTAQDQGQWDTTARSDR